MCSSSTGGTESPLDQAVYLPRSLLKVAVFARGRRRGVGERGQPAWRGLRCAILSKSAEVGKNPKRVGPGRVNSVQGAIKGLEGSVVSALIY